MQHLPDHLRTRENFQEAAALQFSTHYAYTGKIPFIYKELAITEDLSRYKDKKILVVGGGPTTKEVDWDPADYDYLLTCNHFFLGDKTKNVEFDLASLSPEVDVKKPAFNEYWERFPQTKFCFENCEVRKEVISALLDRDQNRVVIVTTRYKSDIGSCPGLLIMATAFKAREVHVVGMDGMPPTHKRGDDTQHAFEPNKEMRSIHYDYNRYVQYYRILWDYLRNDIGKDTKFVNLGHGHPYNISTLYNVQ